MASVFNHYFVNIASKIDDGISQTRKSPLDYLRRKSESSSFFLFPTDTAEVECIITEFKNGKALGPYSIPCNLLKLFSPYISSALVILINESFTTGIFPDKLKMAKVIALHKHLTTCLIIDLFLFCLSLAKYLKQSCTKDYIKFLEINEILHPLQFGFRKNHSTSHTLINMTETIKKTIDNGHFGCGIFIDLKKAFDTVNHSVLLKKLDHYGVRGIPLQRFDSYLAKRQQYLSINGCTSDKLVITHEVSQGSVLGPLLFLIFINDLHSVSKYLTFYLFADDPNIYFESPELSKIEKWLTENFVKSGNG